MDNQALVLAVSGVILGTLLPFVAQYLNELRNWDADKATVAAVALSVVVALAALLVTGQLHFTDFTLKNFVTVFPIVYGMSQLVYALVADRLGWKTPTAHWETK